MFIGVQQRLWYVIYFFIIERIFFLPFHIKNLDEINILYYTFKNTV